MLVFDHRERGNLNLIRKVQLTAMIGPATQNQTVGELIISGINLTGVC